MNEFALIQTYLAGLTGPEGLGLLDDIALWSPPKGHDAVLSLDTLVEGVHFLEGTFGFEVAQKLIRTNVSDIIAKGADPIGYMFSLTLNEKVETTDIERFCNGLAADQKTYGLKLWGGDTTRTLGPTVLSVTIFGTVPKGEIVKRSGAKPGDILCITGAIGDSFLGLKVALNQMGNGFSECNLEFWRKAYNIPNPPFKLRHGIRSLASAALDVSDGLIADAGHMANAAEVSVVINLNDIHLSPESRAWVDEQTDRNAALIALATGGDDYQVLLAVEPDKFEKIYQKSMGLGIQLTKIGRVEHGSEVRVIDENGATIKIHKPGFTHF